MQCSNKINLRFCNPCKGSDFQTATNQLKSNLISLLGLCMLTFIKYKTESMTNLVAHTSKFLSFLDNMKCKSCLARSFFPIDFNHSSLQSARQISNQSCLEDFSKFMAQLEMSTIRSGRHPSQIN